MLEVVCVEGAAEYYMEVDRSLCPRADASIIVWVRDAVLTNVSRADYRWAVSTLVSAGWRGCWTGGGRRCQRGGRWVV